MSITAGPLPTAPADPVLSPPKSQVSTSSGFKQGAISGHVATADDVDLELAVMPPEEAVGCGGDYIKSFVFGGLDGIVSTFALVASLAGGRVEITTLIAVCFAKILADAFSMGFGEFASATAELEHGLRLKEKAQADLDNYAHGKVKETCGLYIDKGCGEEDALTMMSVLFKYKDLFLEHNMMMQGIIPPEEDDKWAPLKQGLVCFSAFAGFGLVPLAGFLVFYAVSDEDQSSDLRTVLIIAYCLTALTLFIMGLTKAKLAGSTSVLKSGVIMVFNGTVAGGVAFLLGDLLSSIF